MLDSKTIKETFVYGERKWLTSLFLISIVFWMFFVLISGYKQHPLGIITQFPLFITAIAGGIIGIKRSIIWGGKKSYLGRAVLLISLAVICWGIGIALWTYFSLKSILAPYPSSADYIVAISMVAWIGGLSQLFVPIGAMEILKNNRGKVGFHLIFFAILTIGYLFQTILIHSSISLTDKGITRAAFDLLYNFGALAIAAIVGIAYIASYRYLGGRLRTPVRILLIGQVIHYIADIVFLYSLNNITYFNGHISDLLFLVAIYMEVLGIVNLDSKRVLNEHS